MNLPPAQEQNRVTSGLTLNLLIAYAHQITTQFIGVQLSIANLLAIAVSALSIVAGSVTVTAQRYPTIWPLWIVAGVIGVGLSILIEGMTLGALIRIRLANAIIKQIEESLERERGDISFWAFGRRIDFYHKKQRATRTHRQSRFYSFPLMLVGSVSSAIAGGLFYHAIFTGLGNWQSLAISALFPFIITCTFISSELFKEAQEAAIKEGFTGGGLRDAAFREETRRLLFQATQDALLADLQDATVQEELRKKRQAVLLHIVDALLTGSHVAKEDDTQHVLIEPAEQQDTTPSAERHPDTTGASRENGKDDTTTALNGHATFLSKWETEHQQILQRTQAHLVVHPHATQAEIAAALGIAVRTLQRHLKQPDAGKKKGALPHTLPTPVQQEKREETP